MAIAFVAVTEIRASTGNSVSGSVTPTAGNALIVPVACYNGSASTTPTASDNKGDTYTADTSGVVTLNASNRYGGAICSAPNVAGGATSVTLSTNTTANGGINGFVYEFSGLATSSMRDATSPAVATGNGTSATTGSLTNVTADALFVAFDWIDASANPATETGNTAGWTYPAGGKETNGSLYIPIGSGYSVVSSAGAQTSNWTVSTGDWGAAIAVYKAAAAAADVLMGQAVM